MFSRFLPRRSERSILEPLHALRQQLRQRFVLQADGGRAINSQVMEALVAMTHQRRDGEALAQFLADCIDQQALESFTLGGSAAQDPGRAKSTRQALASFLRVALEASRISEDEPFEATALETVIDQWVVDSRLIGHASPYAPTLSLFGQTIAASAGSPEGAAVTRLGIAIGAAAPIVMWGLIERLPTGKDRPAVPA